MARRFAEVIGDPIAHSKSPMLHGNWLKQLRVDGEYFARRVTDDELAGFVTRLGRACSR
jgi:shikimate dehydrogenase